VRALLGYREDVATILAASDLLASPTRYEAYGLNVHEAICRGVPALVSRSAGVAERYPPELRSWLLDDPDDVVTLERTIGDTLDAQGPAAGPTMRSTTSPKSSGRAAGMTWPTISSGSGTTRAEA
jgi:glycosyltransferase involved in cell wall biosynthesis